MNANAIMIYQNNSLTCAKNGNISPFNLPFLIKTKAHRKKNSQLNKSQKHYVLNRNLAKEYPCTKNVENVVHCLSHRINM